MEKYQETWSVYQKALYWDKVENWDKAHELVQDLNTPEAAWIHAYLHRKEEDEGNAAYWYRKAGKDFYKGTLSQEWEALWENFNN
jgi:hypothetical protein